MNNQEQPTDLSSTPPGLPETDRQTAPHNKVGLDRVNQLAITAIVLLVYGITMCRTIYAGDDGDFITAMATLGNCHPTGYPVFLLLGNLALTLFAPLLPDPASRVNALTVICGGVAVSIFYRFLTNLKLERYLCWTAALLLAFSPTLWQQSLSCEVYALTAAYLSGLLWMAVAWWERPFDNRLLRWFAVLYGLACTNNMMVALFFPGFLALVLYRRPSLFRQDLTVLLSLVPCFIAPLLFYLYLPWSALRHTPVNWGDPSNWSGFVAKISGQQYRSLMFQSTEAFLQNSGDYFFRWEKGAFVPGYLLKEFSFYLIWLLPIGAVALWKRVARPIVLLLLFIVAINLLYSFNYAIGDIYAYYIPSYMILTVFLGMAASFVIAGVLDRLRLPGEKREHYQPLIALVCLAIPLVILSAHYAETDRSGNTQQDDFAVNILQSAPPNALIITSSDVTFTLWYEKYVRHIRPDVVLINRNLLRSAFSANAWYYRHVQDQYPDIANTFAARSATSEEAMRNDLLFAMITRALQRSVPVVWLPDPRADREADFPGATVTVEEHIDRAFARYPLGIIERLSEKNAQVSERDLWAENKAVWERLRFRQLATWAHADPAMGNIPLRYAESFLAWGRLCERHGEADGAIAAYKNALSLYDIGEAHQALKRLGVSE